MHLYALLNQHTHIMGWHHILHGHDSRLHATWRQGKVILCCGGSLSDVEPRSSLLAGHRPDPGQGTLRIWTLFFLSQDDEPKTIAGLNCSLPEIAMLYCTWGQTFHKRGQTDLYFEGP